ncbi:MAG: hypothetical protein JNL58_29700 [Planctomyces sp.]|nr:hypothetical protein [Planctomyces sp.]
MAMRFGKRNWVSAMGLLTLSVSCSIPAFFIESAAAQVTDTDTSGVKAETVQLRKLSVAEVRSEVDRWISKAGASETEQQKVNTLWSSATAGDAASEDILELTMESFALVDPMSAELIKASRSAAALKLPSLDGPRDDKFYDMCVRLYLGRWLAQHRYFDEGLEQLDALSPDQNIDPAGLLFYRAVCQKSLLKREAAEDSLTLLLNNVVDVPVRFRAVAEIMQNELRDQNPEGLGEVSRVMSDVQRRLDLGNSGRKVQDQEQQVIALLDKLLEDMEQQDKQNSPSGGEGGGDGGSPQQGADRSTIKGNPAEGIADRKELSENGAWGMLDKQAEAQARELIRQQFPSNYLDAISRYTKKIAERK